MEKKREKGQISFTEAWLTSIYCSREHLSEINVPPLSAKLKRLFYVTLHISSLLTHTYTYAYSYILHLTLGEKERSRRVQREKFVLCR